MLRNNGTCFRTPDSRVDKVTLRNPSLPALNDSQKANEGIGGGIGKQEKQYAKIRVMDGKADGYSAKDNDSQLQNPNEIQRGLIILRFPIPIIPCGGIFWSPRKRPIAVG